MKKQSIDIKSLTAELKSFNQAEKNTDTSGNSQGGNQKKNLYADRSTSKDLDKEDTSKNVEGVDKLYQLIANANARDHYKVDRFIYVDNDIHEVLIKLKVQTKLKISHLVSSLLEDLIIEHKRAILEILSKKQNKFLD